MLIRMYHQSSDSMHAIMQERDNKNNKLIIKAEVKTVSRQDLPTLQLIFCLRWQVKHQKDVISVVLFNLYHFS